MGGISKSPWVSIQNWFNDMDDLILFHGHPFSLDDDWGGNLGYIPYDTLISKPSQVLQQPQGCSSHYPLGGALVVDPRSGYNVSQRSTQHVTQVYINVAQRSIQCVTQVYVANYPKYEMSTHPHRALYQLPANISDWWTILIYILLRFQPRKRGVNHRNVWMQRRHHQKMWF